MGDKLTDQPDGTPTRKVAATGTAGAAAVLVLAVLAAVGVEVPGVDLDGLPVSEALTLLVAVVAGYLTRERA